MVARLWCDHDHVVVAAIFEEGANVSEHDVRTRELESACSPAKKINFLADQEQTSLFCLVLLFQVACFHVFN